MVLSASSVHCPSWSTCFELELPQISCIFFQCELWLWFLNTLFPEWCVACCTPHQWTDFAEKWPGKNEFFLCELGLIHCEATQGVVLAQLQSNCAMLWEQSREGPGAFEAGVNLPPHPIYNELCKHCQSLYFHRAALLCVVSHQIHLLSTLFISLMSTSLVSPLHPLRFSPQNKSTSIKFAGGHPYANFCRFTKSTLFK